MAAALFGTDGIRGVFGSYPLDQPTVTALGRELGSLLATRSDRPVVVLGGDTRDSTPVLAGWLASGLGAAGATPRDAGVLPTPGVAWLTRTSGAACGIAVSASHNLHPDNGIKLIGADGFKWSEGAEEALATRIASAVHTNAPTHRPPSAATGQRPGRVDPVIASSYLRTIVTSVAGVTAAGERRLRGLRVILDTANGAASDFAGELFSSLGAAVTLMNDHPDGRNINQGCGSTHPQPLAAAVVAAGADLGVGFDGDADRAILCDERGAITDGDAMLFLWARDLHRSGGLHPPAIVATSMSNLGLERALAREGIEVVRCDVGDRAVVATLRARGLRLGGEQSGHLVDLARSTTGDGLLTALQLADCIVRAGRAGRPLSELVRPFQRFPQLLRNVRVADKLALDTLPGVVRVRDAIAARLGGEGRLVLRYSGTEPLARIMLEGPEQPAIEAMADELEDALRAALGAPV